jgi:hypothetical protein
MIIEQKKLFFKTVSIILEDDRILDAYTSKKYSSIIALSYKDLELPAFVKYSKPTLCIDLTKDSEAVFGSFNDTTRNEIRKTYKIPELSFHLALNPTKESYALYKKFEYSQGRVPVTLASLQGMPSFEARYNNEIISCIYVIDCKPFLRVRSIFSKRIDAENRQMYNIIAYATRRLVWDICEWGKKNDFVSLDLASVNVDNPKTKSIARFKMSFGKVLVPEYTYIYKSSAFSFFEKFAFLKLAIKRIFS